MKVYNKLTVDIKRKNTDIITAKQNDTASRFLDIILVDNGVPLNLTGHTVKMYGKKADGKEIYTNGTITEATKGRCQFELTTQALAVANDLTVEIAILKENKEILSTLPFTIHVVKSLISDSAIESSNEYGALVVLYQNLHEAYSLMTEMVEKIGEPEAKAKELKLETMFEVWDYMLDYLLKNSTATVVSTTNTINSKMGTSTSTSDSTIFGKLNNGLKKTYPVYSDKEQIILLSKEVTCNHVNGTDDSKYIFLKPCKPLKAGTYKVKIYYTRKFETISSNSTYNSYGIDLIDHLIDANEYITGVDTYAEGSVINASAETFVKTKIKNFTSSSSTTDVGNYYAWVILRVISDNYVPNFRLRAQFYSNRMSGYIKFTKVVLCFNEEEY